ncbi:MAG: glycosyltransferase [Chitinivibrionales bacterium]|nr:glycosyltransferase [Chitinivibrionales bacterium]
MIYEKQFHYLKKTVCAVKLVIQIPCYNEENTLEETIASLPHHIDGIDEIEVLVIDDGSTDRSIEVAQNTGAKVLRLSRHLGLADAFASGVKAAIEHDADILVNTDADLQYPSEHIERLIRPILEKKADISVGDRLSHKPRPFSPVKMMFEHMGTAFVRSMSGVDIKDAASGFRAFSKEALELMFIHGKFSYTLESLVLAGMRKLRVANVTIPINPPKRKSRLFSSMGHYIVQSVFSVIRAYLMYHPLKFFVSVGLLFLAASAVIGFRFLLFYFLEGGAGHIQSLILLAILAFFGVLSIILGLVGDIIAANRRILEELRHTVMKQSNGK